MTFPINPAGRGVRTRAAAGDEARRQLAAVVVDAAVLLAVLVGLYLLLHAGHGADVRFAASRSLHVGTDPWLLPGDALRSLIRMFIALALSIAFTLVYGYAAARSRRAERVLVPLLDILQSVPVLGFLSVTVTAFIALFPGNELGLECASIFAIFTSQAWNLTFSFYHSVKAVPRELDEMSRMLQLTRWQRFCKLEVPHAMIGLVWNGMMSFGGGWFFLAASEAITVLNHNYQLPGVGSYVAQAVAESKLGDVGWGILTMILMILAVNVLFWRPLTAFAERYKVEQSASAQAPRSLVLDLLRRSHWPRAIGRVRRSIAEPLGRAMAILGRDGTAAPRRAGPERARDVVFNAAVIAAIAFGADHLVTYIGHGVGLGGFGHAAWLGAVTLGRVIVLIIASTIVWVPVGVWIGSNPRVARTAQPVVQILASFPAVFLFPFAVLAFIKLGLSLNIGGILLMALGAQWYILFNAIAGAMSIPTDLREAMRVMGVRGWLRWRRMILPALLPTYVTGGITAAGGAWNASIVAEIVTYGPHTLVATGLGAYIAQASAHGDFPRLLTGITVMSLYVVGINALFWRRLYRLAVDRFSL